MCFWPITPKQKSPGAVRVNDVAAELQMIQKSAVQRFHPGIVDRIKSLRFYRQQTSKHEQQRTRRAQPLESLFDLEA